MVGEWGVLDGTEHSTLCHPGQVSSAGTWERYKLSPALLRLSLSRWHWNEPKMVRDPRHQEI